MRNPIIRPAEAADADAIWAIIDPVVRAGDTYALAPDIAREDALAYWHAPGNRVFLAEIGGEVLGTYVLRANARGHGDHVANCAYMTARAAQGRGIASAMCRDSLDRARAHGFRAMQFNFVVATNTRAIALWQHFGFEIVGTLPGAFRHPEHGFVDAHVMYRWLDG
ncbi:L-amino acid N-acyltransferase YncA [Limimonas halophila]|uniref:L-amino acid N-acyltransferase YncA n=1 Tax=Limimonas halophila TaxID=1082479 RepID=A0A1G7RG91_9PROT|nr:GNAT family N-acetyltransferase [Limimonas halophila]SDG09773.1 L-amino acid N-acyltransferase YncA [Limimonas halophila]